MGSWTGLDRGREREAVLRQIDIPHIGRDMALLNHSDLLFEPTPWMISYRWCTPSIINPQKHTGA